MDAIVALSGRSLELGVAPRKPLARPPHGLVQDILHCARHTKVNTAIHRVAHTLAGGEPVVHVGSVPDTETFDPRALRKFILDAAWSLMVFNMVAFRVRPGRGSSIALTCVPICEGTIERGVHVKTGELLYRWIEPENDAPKDDPPFIFSVNPSDIGGGWFNSAVMNLREAVHLYNEMRANYVVADHALARPPIPLVYDRTKLFGSRSMGDTALGDITENNAGGMQDEMILVHQTIRTNLSGRSGAIMDAQQYDMNAASAAGSVAPIYQEVGPTEHITSGGESRHASGPVLYITPGYTPASSTYAPSRNNDFMRMRFLEQQISSNLGVPLHWMIEEGAGARNTVDSEADADKLKICIEILRQQISELFAFIDERLADDGDLEPGPQCVSLRWMRTIEMRTIYIEKRTTQVVEVPAKRRKTEDDEDKDDSSEEGTDEDEIKLDSRDIDDTA